MFGLRRALFTSILCLAVSLPLTAADPAPNFEKVVQKHYATWAKGLPDGKLTADRVNSLVNNPRLHGEEAAALAAIHLQFRGANAPSALDEATLLDHERAKLPEERRDQLTKPVNFDRVFARYLKHINTVPHELFEKGAPQRTGISQGNLGDCFVIAGIGTLVTQHPNRIKSMIHAESNGSYTVSFPGIKPMHVPKLTDAQIALGSTAGQQGLWLNVIEEAVALEFRTRDSSKVALDVISKGGNTGRTLELLTNHKVEVVGLHLDGNVEKHPSHLDTLRILNNVDEHKILACATTTGKFTMPPGIASGHAYGVLDFDPKAKVVTVWNPWGNHFEPKGTTGIANGYPTQDGKFLVPLAEFEKVFTKLFAQTGTPLPVKK